MAVPVVSPNSLGASDPFVLLMDDRLEMRSRRQIGGAIHTQGLETMTLVLEGAMRDRDEGVLTAGDVIWMTAGRGIIHSEAVEVEGRARILLPLAGRRSTILAGALTHRNCYSNWPDARAQRSTALRSVLLPRTALVPDRYPGHPPRPKPGRRDPPSVRPGSTAAPVAALGGPSVAVSPHLPGVAGLLAAADAPAQQSHRRSG